jgi:hypothetical protein
MEDVLENQDWVKKAPVQFLNIDLPLLIQHKDSKINLPIAPYIHAYPSPKSGECF